MERIMTEIATALGPSVSDAIWDLMAEVEKRFPQEPLPLRETYSIYYAATMDQPKRLAAALNDIKNEELREFLVNVRFGEGNGQSLTPLTMAAMAGSTPFVKSLLNNYKIDLERESNVIFDGLMVYGATALWVAAGMGHLQVVKLLVKGGAAVNHNTKAQSSPLRAACYEGRLDIVKYLIKHGADVNLGNSYNNTCIMIAAYKGHTLVVDALLKQGADPNEQALCGATALHYAAKCGHLDVCRLLLDRGATMQRNEFGLTPVMQAAEHAHEAIVEMFVQRPGLMTMEEIIDATELLGASFANSKDNYNVVKAHQYMMHAMELRYSDPAKLRRKKVMPPVPAYDSWFETENIPELNAIRLNHHSIHMEALTIRERILGRKYPDLPECIVHRGAVMADQGRFAQCQILWEYAIDLKMMNDVPVDRDLLRFAQIFSLITRRENHALDLSTLLSILDKCEKEIENNRNKLAHPGPKDIPRLISDQSDQNIITALFLISIFGRLLPTVEKHHCEQLNTILRKLIKCDTRMCDGQTLLHLAVNGERPVDEYTGELCRFPCFRTALLLIHGGASVLALDCERNTPLHTLIKSTQAMRDPQEIREVEDIIKLFVDAGAHLDAVNAQGLAPVHLSNDANRILYLLLNYEHEHITLKCLASRCIVRQKLKYRGLIPQALESFIQMHSAENACA